MRQVFEGIHGVLNIRVPFAFGRKRPVTNAPITFAIFSSPTDEGSMGFRIVCRGRAMFKRQCSITERTRSSGTRIDYIVEKSPEPASNSLIRPLWGSNHCQIVQTASCIRS